MTKINSTNRKKMMKEKKLGPLRRKSEQKKEHKYKNYNRLSPREFYKSYLAIETKTVTLSDTQDNDI